MPPRAKSQTLGHLRATIADIERRPVLADGATEPRRFPGGVLATPPGHLQEVFTDEHRHVGAAFGFALAQAMRFLDPARPAVIHLGLVREGQDLGLPYGPGLAAAGLDPATLVLVQAADPRQLLWAAEEALACRAVAAVVAEIGGQPKSLDFTASRRLSLRAAAAGTSLFLVRYGRWREASAASWRWQVSPDASGPMAFDARAPGAARWRVTLEKGVLDTGAPPVDWIVEWTRHGLERIDEAEQRADGVRPAAPLSGADPARLGDRLRAAS
jgi:protein ImuA